MSEFWSSHLDYVFFIYGLSFILMAVQCSILSARDRSLPWGLLAAFGVIHGVSQWLDMLTLSLSDTPVFLGVRVLVKAVAFVFLIEFGRRGISRDGRPIGGRWLMPMLVGLAALGALSGDLNGLSAVCRYTLGCPGALLAAVALWRVSRTCADNQRSGLRLASLSMLVFGLATGLVVPKASFFPAFWLNQDTFITATGFPVQLIRMFCAFAVMTGLWFYGMRIESSTEDIGFVRRWVCPAAFVLLLGLGWFVADWRGKSLEADMRGRLLDQAILLADTINPERVKELSFTAADKGNPAFQRLRDQLIAYAQIGDQRGLWTVASRDGGLVFGPETYEVNTAIASSPGTKYEGPPQELQRVFENKKAFVIGPYTDEYGTFVSAFAPVLDPHSGKVLMVIGLDIMADKWKAQVAVARLMPIIVALVLLLIMLGGLGAVRWRNALALDKQIRLHYMEPAITATIGLTLTFILSLLALESENRERGNVFRKITKIYAEKVDDGFHTIRSDTAALGRFMQTDEQVTRQEFHDYTNPIVKSGVIQGFGWVQHVSAIERDRFESEARREGIGDFTIWQKNNQGKRIPAKPCAEYYPVFYAEPSNDKAALGFDECSEPARRAALEEAAGTGYATATDSVAAVNETAGRQALMVFQPVYAKQDSTSGKRRLSGLVIGMVHYQAIVDRAMQSDINFENSIQMHLVDMMSTDGPRVLALTSNDATQNHSEIVDKSNLTQYKFQATFPIFAFGRAYMVFSHPTPQYFALHPALKFIVTGIAGVLVTVTVSLLAGFIRNRQAFLEREVNDRTVKLQESEKQFRSLFEDSREAMQTLEPPSWLYASCNQATLDLFGAKDKEEFLAMAFSNVSPETQPDGRASDEKAMEMVETAIREGSHSFEWMHKRMNGETFPATVLISRLEREGRVYIQVTVRDITERKQAERRQHLSADILRILNEPIELTDSINKILTAIKLETGFDAVGLRLKNGDDFPYFVQHGFSDDFLLAENTLVAFAKKGGACRDKDGNISLECTCGLVLSGQTDPTHPLFTPNGSCWTNNSLPLLDMPADQDPRLHPRNRCIHDGFLSVALVPIRANQEIVGLLQLNDRKADRLTIEMIHQFEEIASNIGLALMKKQSDEEVRSARAFLNNSMNAVADPIFVKDEKRRFVLVNDALCDIVGRSREQLIGEDGDDMFPSDQVEVFRKMDDAILDTGEENVNEESLTDLSDDSVNTIVTRKTRYVDPDGKRFIVGVIRDITERKRMEDALKNEKDNLAAIFASSPVGMLLLDEDTMIVNANSVIAGMVSRNLESIVHQRGGGGLGCVHSLENEKGCGFASVCPDCTLRQGITQVLKTGTSIRGAEIQVALLIDGQEHHQWLRVSAEPVTINGCKHVVVAVDDITEQKQAEEELRQANAEIDKVNRQLEYALLAANQHAIEIEVAKDQVEEDAVAMDYQAHHDSLTSLPNRKLFSKELTKHVSDRRRKRKQFAVLFIDLDKFKIVNDTLGHKAGDSVLVETAARLSSCLREGDILARMGGDEFTVMLRNTKSKDDAAMVAQRMIEQVSVPFKFGEHKMVIGASVGVSIYPENATDADGLLKTADAAMYKAKESGRNNCQFFSEEIRQKYHSRLEIERDLNLAVEQKTLVVQYQPIIDVETMQVVGAEAMLLWNHQDKGLVSPSLFIPVAEENGLILPMNKMVMETACQQCKKWQDMGYSDFEISVAVSTAQLNDIKFIAEVEAALSAVGLSQHCLILQVTESILEQSSDDKAEMLRFLKAFGVRICLDDFGVGYSSLSKLKDVPIAHLKVNGFFTSNVDRNRNDRAMTESIIGMAHNLGIKVTAEGIEDVEQMATIKSLKCDYAQGDLISPALPQPEFEDFMRRAAMEAQRSAA